MTRTQDPSSTRIEPAELRQARAAVQSEYLERLRAFAAAAGGEGAGEIVEKAACRIDGVLMQFSLHEATLQIGVHADVGKPEPWQELEACRRLLELQFHQGTPAIWLVSRHRDSGHLVLSSHVPMTERLRDDVEHLHLLAKACAPVAKGLAGVCLR